MKPLALTTAALAALLLSSAACQASTFSGSSSGGAGLSSSPATPPPTAGLDLGDLMVTDALVSNPGADGVTDGDADDLSLWRDVGVQGGYLAVVNATRPTHSNARCTASSTPTPCCTGAGTGTCDLSGSSTCADINAALVEASDDCVADAACGEPPLAELGRIVSLPEATYSCVGDAIRGRSFTELVGAGAFGATRTVIETDVDEETGSHCIFDAQAVGGNLIGCGAVNTWGDAGAAVSIVDTTVPIGKAAWSVTDANYAAIGSPVVGDLFKAYLNDSHNNLPYEFNNSVIATHAFALGQVTDVSAAGGNTTVTIDDPLEHDWDSGTGGGATDVRVQKIIDPVQWFGVRDLELRNTKPLTVAFGSGGADAWTLGALQFTHCINCWADTINLPYARDTHLQFRTSKNVTVVRTFLGKNLCLDETLWDDAGEFEQNAYVMTPAVDDSSKCSRGGEYSIEMEYSARQIHMALMVFDEVNTHVRPYHYSNDNSISYWYSEDCSPTVRDGASNTDGIKPHGYFPYNWLVEGNDLCNSYRPDGVWGRDGKFVLYLNRFAGEVRNAANPLSYSSIFNRINLFRVSDDLVAIGNIMSGGMVTDGNCGSEFDSTGSCLAFDYINPAACINDYSTGVCDDDAHSGFSYEISYNVAGLSIKTVPETLTLCDGMGSCSTDGGSTNISGATSHGTAFDGVAHPASLQYKGETGDHSFEWFNGAPWPDSGTYPCACDFGGVGAFVDDLAATLCKTPSEIWYRETVLEVAACP